MSELRRGKSLTDTCPKCDSLLYLDEWVGWVWVCVQCGSEHRQATDEEIVAEQAAIWGQNAGDRARDEEETWPGPEKDSPSPER